MKERYGTLSRVRFIESDKIYPVELLLIEQKGINIFQCYNLSFSGQGLRKAIQFTLDN